MKVGIGDQGSGIRGDSAFRIQHSGFSIQDSGELLLHFSLLPTQHVRHASVGWHPISFLSSVGWICGRRLSNKKNGIPAFAGMTEFWGGLVLKSNSFLFNTHRSVLGRHLA
jgi:hypothetical protein